MMHSTMEYLLKIIARYNDNKSALANRLVEIKGVGKLSASHINNWLTRDKKIPHEWVIPLSKSADWEYTPHMICPEVYPHPEDGLPREMRCNCEKAA